MRRRRRRRRRRGRTTTADDDQLLLMQHLSIIPSFPMFITAMTGAMTDWFVDEPQTVVCGVVCSRIDVPSVRTHRQRCKNTSTAFQTCVTEACRGYRATAPGVHCEAKEHHVLSGLDFQRTVEQLGVGLQV